ncbi:MAG: hypothetical protein KDA89_22515, partial [Planctomycetaceae bacterium]|nr:hypothetical protein [Planctomycetaceae bacterium]
MSPSAGSGGVGGQTGSTPRVLTKDDYVRAMSLLNRGTGFLENLQWAEAEGAFAELADLLPQNITARKNLAVSRVLSIVDRASALTQSGSPDNAARYRNAVNAALAAVDAYRSAATANDDAALADLLQGKLLVHDDSPESPSIESGLALLRDAADALPDRADFRFALAIAMDGHRDYADPASPKAVRLLEALTDAFRLAPQNLFALQKLMQRQALCLNSKDPAVREAALKITETMSAAAELLKPLNESIKKQRRVDLIENLTKAVATFDGNNPAALMGPAMMAGNLLLPEIATQIDQRRINRNLLEYLSTDFDEDFTAAAEQAGAYPEQPPSVVQSFAVADGLPKLTGVTDVDYLDMNLDGFDDLITARDGRIEVYTRGTDLNAEWTQMMTSPDVEGLRSERMLLVDIDRDYDRALSDIKSPHLLRDADGDLKIPTDPADKN